MKPGDFRIGWRLLAAEPAYSAVTILGLAAGLATCFLLLAFVRFSFGYNSHVPAARDVYAMKQHLNIVSKPGWFEMTSLPMLKVAERSGMTQATALAMPGTAAARTAAGMQSIPILGVSAGFPAVFGLRAAEGDLAQALSRPDAVALTYDTALRTLGTRLALGRTLQLDGKTFTVAALLDEPPATGTLAYGALFGLGSNLIPQGFRHYLETTWGSATGYLYARLAPGADPAPLQAYLQHGFDTSPLVRGMPDVMRGLKGRKATDVALVALPDLYFDRDLLGRPGSTAHGDRQVVLGLAAVGFLVLVLACANYVNLAGVRAVRRQPEIALRKVLGAGAGRIVAQFMAEALVMALLATLLGLLFAWLLLPTFAAMLDRPLETMMTPAAVLAALLLGAGTGLVAGLYPAWIALGMRPAEALGTRHEQETAAGLWLRRALTVLQLTVAMSLTAGTLAIAWQTRFASAADPGFDPAPLLVVELSNALRNSSQGRQLREALRHLPGVAGVAYSENAVGSVFAGSNSGYRRPGGADVVLVGRNVSTDFFDVYGIRAVAGRAFDPKLEQDGNVNAVMLNAAGARALGFATPAAAVGQIVTYTDGGKEFAPRVIGIAPDLRHESLREKPQPMIYKNSLLASTLTIRARGDMNRLQELALEQYRRFFPNDLPVVRPAASYLAESYRQDLRLAQMLGAASLVAILLSAFGIYVLSAYNVQRRAREIVLRKLFGAGRAAIARLLGREFAVLLAAGAIIGLPPAALGIRAYLAGFVERAPIGGWTLLAAVSIAACVALLATARHTIAALRATPAAVLRG